MGGSTVPLVKQADAYFSFTDTNSRHSFLVEIWWTPVATPVFGGSTHRSKRVCDGLDLDARDRLAVQHTGGVTDLNVIDVERPPLQPVVPTAFPWMDRAWGHPRSVPFE